MSCDKNEWEKEGYTVDNLIDLDSSDLDSDIKPLDFDILKTEERNKINASSWGKGSNNIIESNYTVIDTSRKNPKKIKKTRREKKAEREAAIPINPRTGKPYIKPGRKKIKGCIIAFSVLLFVFVILPISLFLIAGDIITRAFLDMGFFRVISTINSINSTPSRRQINNLIGERQTDAHRIQFEDSLRDQLFLNSNVAIPYDIFVDTLLENSLNGGNEYNGVAPQHGVLREELLLTALRDNTSITNEQYEAADNNPLFAVLYDILQRENMNLNALNAYDGSARPLTTNGLMLGAFIDHLLTLSGNAFNENQNNINGFSPLAVMAHTSVAAIRFMGTPDIPVVRLIGEFNLRELIRLAAGDMTGDNFWINFLVNRTFSDRIFITMDLSLPQPAVGSPTIGIRFNNLNDNRMERAFNLVNAIMDTINSMGRDEEGRLPILRIDVPFLTSRERYELGDFEFFDLQEFLDDFISERTERFMPYVHEHINFARVEEGYISLDILDSAIMVMGINDGREEHLRIRSQDIYFSMRYLLISHYVQNQQHTFLNQWREEGQEDTRHSMTPVANAALVSYQDEFLAEFRQMFALSDEVTFSTLAGLMGIGDSSDPMDFLGYLEISQFVHLANQHDDYSRLTVTDRMLGAIFQYFLETVLDSEDEILHQMSPSVSHVFLREDTDGHQWFEVAFRINVLGVEVIPPFVRDILPNLLPPQGMSLTATIDITPYRDIGYIDVPNPDYPNYSSYPYLQERVPHKTGEIRANNLNLNESNHVINIINRFANGRFSIPELLNSVEVPFRDIVNSMVEFIPGLVLVQSRDIAYRIESSMQFGSMFEIVIDQMNQLATNDNDKLLDTYDYTAVEQLRSIIIEIWDITPEDFIGKGANDDYSEFIDNAIDAFYLINLPEGISVVGLYDRIREGEFDAVNIDRRRMAYDNRDMEELYLFFGERDFSAIMRKALQDQIEVSGESTHVLEGFTEVAGVKIRPDLSHYDAGIDYSPYGSITMVIKANLWNIMSEHADARFNSLIPEAMYFSFEFYISDVKCSIECIQISGDCGEYCEPYFGATLSINDMAEGSIEFENLMRIVRLVNGGIDPFDITDLRQEAGRAAYIEIERMRENAGLDNVRFRTREVYCEDENDYILEHGLEMRSIFHILASRRGSNPGDLDAEEIRAAIQGLWSICGRPGGYRYRTVRNPKYGNPDYPNAEPFLAPEKYYLEDFTSKGSSHNFDMNDIVWNEIPYSQPTIIDIAQPIDDYKFGWLLRDGFSGFITNPFESLFNPRNPFAYDSYRLVQFISSGNTISLTFEIAYNRQFFETGSYRNYWDFIPDYMYLTVDLTRASLADPFEPSAFIINQLTPEQQRQLFILTGFNVSVLYDIIGNAAAVLNSLPFVFGNGIVEIPSGILS